RMVRRPAFRRFDRDGVLPRRCAGRERGRRQFPLDPIPAAGAGGDRRRHCGAAAHSPRPRAAIPDRRPAAMTETLRKPAIFSVDDPRLVIARPEEAPRLNVDSIAEAPADNLPAVLTPRKRRIPWGTLFWSALSGLVLLALGLAVTNLVEDLYARAPWLGAIGLALALLAGLALLVVMLREIIGLARLSTVESLRQR